MEALTNPWVIGIGTTIIAGIIVGLILYYVFRIGKAEPRKQMSSSLPAIEEKPISNILPKEIIEHLDSLPPLQRESAAKNYEGIKVSWEVTLRSAFFNRVNGEPYVIMVHERNYQIVCSVDLEQYPELRVMKEGHQFRIEGEIASVGRLGIRLRNCRFHF